MEKFSFFFSIFILIQSLFAVASSQKTLILGSSFQPPTKAHLALACSLIDAIDPEVLLLLPTPTYKPGLEEGLTPLLLSQVALEDFAFECGLNKCDRLDGKHCLVKKNKKNVMLSASNFLFELNEHKETALRESAKAAIRFLPLLRKELGIEPKDIFWIAGADSAMSLPRWVDADPTNLGGGFFSLFLEANWIVVPRSGDMRVGLNKDHPLMISQEWGWSPLAAKLWTEFMPAEPARDHEHPKLTVYETHWPEELKLRPEQPKKPCSVIFYDWDSPEISSTAIRSCLKAQYMLEKSPSKSSPILLQHLDTCLAADSFKEANSMENSALRSRLDERLSSMVSKNVLQSIYQNKLYEEKSSSLKL